MIIIPKQFYVGLRSQSKEESDLPLGFLTPYEPDTKAYEKRKETVDAWTEGHYRKKKIDPKIIDNEPQEGFAIAEEIRRIYWGGGNVVWRMKDPRGYEFEISSSNLARILDCSTINNGVIQSACVFGRDKAQNLLLPVNSEPYVEASKNTVRASKKISTRDIKSGDVIVLKSGKQVQYLGYHDVGCIKWQENRYVDHTSFNVLASKKRHLLLTKATNDNDHHWGVKAGSYFISGLSDLHVSEIVETGKKIPIDFTNRYVNGVDDSYAVINKNDNIELSFEEISEDKFVGIMLEGSYTRKYTIHFVVNGNKFVPGDIGYSLYTKKRLFDDQGRATFWSRPLIVTDLETGAFELGAKIQPRVSKAEFENAKFYMLVGKRNGEEIALFPK